MSKCILCRWERGSHDPACPEVSEDKKQALMDNQRGYRSGRAGEDLQEESSAFKLGWRCGVVALEEAENGYDPRFS